MIIFWKKETKLSTSVHSVGFTDWGICVHMLYTERC